MEAKIRLAAVRRSYLYPMKFILYAILIYLAYQFVFNFLIPIYRVSRKVKKGFREMQQRMQEQQQAFEKQSQPTPAQPSRPASDYIEFEELK